MADETRPDKGRDHDERQHILELAILHLHSAMEESAAGHPLAYGLHLDDAVACIAKLRAAA